jgi:DNA-binding transcriptional MerR regulator
MSTSNAATDAPLFEPDLDATYDLEIVTELTGLSTQTLLHYQEQGLIPCASSSGSVSESINEETLRRLRHIEQLRSAYELNIAGIKHIFELMDQIEALQSELRSRR